MFESTSPTAPQSNAFTSLANWFSQPIEMAPGFDIESIKPPPRPATVVADNLLEVTVWDLYEPGKPYSFPVRVSTRQTIDVPLLGEVVVDGRTIPEIEALLVDGFRQREYLLNPRLLVRSLDAPMVKIHVTGAVNRGGFAEVARADASVYAAIISAGGLKKTAGTQVGVARRTACAASGPDLSTNANERVPESAAGDSTAPAPLNASNRAALHANSVDELSVPPAAAADRTKASNQALFAVETSAPPLKTSGAAAMHFSPAGTNAHFAGAGPATAHRAPEPARDPDQSTVWYNVSLAPDREQLVALQLGEGDTVTVKAANQPLRIGGVVNRPGAYPLPAGRNLNVWQAIDQAGGIRGEHVPLNITLLRPAGEGRAARRWYLNVAEYDQHPAASPFVEPGDVLHVEPTAGSKIKRAVGDLWNKP